MERERKAGCAVSGGYYPPYFDAETMTVIHGDGGYELAYCPPHLAVEAVVRYIHRKEYELEREHKARMKRERFRLIQGGKGGDA